MAARSFVRSNFPPRSRQELYGATQPVHLWWTDNLWFSAAASSRPQQATSSNAFVAGLMLIANWNDLSILSRWFGLS